MLTDKWFNGTTAERTAMFTATLCRSVLLCAAALPIAVLAGPRIAICAQGDCSQPASTGANPVATDCLFILQVAINLQACMPRACVCDPTGDASTTATDALLCLRKAVSEPVTLLCPCDTTTSTTTTTVPGGGSDCTDDGFCSNDDCVCSDCDDDLFCGDPNSCNFNDICSPFQEGCACTDCTTHPDCLDN